MPVMPISPTVPLLSERAQGLLVRVNMQLLLALTQQEIRSQLDLLLLVILQVLLNKAATVLQSGTKLRKAITVLQNT